MSKETKVGLLVGLAFVILFGIILSEKGANNTQFTSPNITSYKPIVELIPPAESPEVKFDKENTPVVDKVKILAPDVKLTANENKKKEKVIKLPPTENTPEDSTEQPKTDELAPVLKEKIHSKPKRNLVELKGEPSPAKQKASEEVQLIKYQTYIVKPGDTLIKICRKFYPQNAYKMVKKIMQINNIPKPELLKANQAIKLPILTPSKTVAQNIKFVEVNSPTIQAIGNLESTKPVKITLIGKSENKTKAIKSKPLIIKTYTVKENDSLSKIAKKIYGKEKMWIKIYEFNKDILSDPDKIRCGIKIKLPISAEVLANSE